MGLRADRFRDRGGQLVHSGHRGAGEPAFRSGSGIGAWRRRGGSVFAAIGARLAVVRRWIVLPDPSVGRRAQPDGRCGCGVSVAHPEHVAAIGPARRRREIEPIAGTGQPAALGTAFDDLDASLPPRLALLPIETRLRGLSLAELRPREDQWQHVPLDGLGAAVGELYFIGADHTCNIYLATHGIDGIENIGAAPQHHGVFLNIDHRYRRLWRNSRYLTPDEMINHDVSDDQHTRTREICNDFQRLFFRDILIHVSAKLPKNEDSIKEKKRRLRYVFLCKMLRDVSTKNRICQLLSSGMFLQEIQIETRKGPEIISPGLFD